MKLAEFKIKFHEELSRYDERDRTGMFRMCLEHFGFSNLSLIREPDLTLSEEQQLSLEGILEELKKGRPIQYVLGRTDFYGIEILVDENVLIPRPETAELVEWILKDSGADFQGSIIDIGTGSGCIALAIKSEMKAAQVSGVDLSAGALEMASKNAQHNNLEVDFAPKDIRAKENWGEQKYDIVVCNPPYIEPKEKVKMTQEVLDYEPEMALFTPDDQPLFFYDLVSDFAIQNLKETGSLYFELSEYFSEEVSSMLRGKGFREIELSHDLSGKPRMLRAKR